MEIFRTALHGPGSIAQSVALDYRRQLAKAKGFRDARCPRTKVLLLDDLGKQKMTERSELELFDLLEHRSSHELPIIWTANVAKGDLRKMLSSDRGEPILRRISEFTKIINI